MKKLKFNYIISIEKSANKIGELKWKPRKPWESTHTHTHTHYIYQTVKETLNINVLANNAKAYLAYVNFNFSKIIIKYRDGETI